MLRIQRENVNAQRVVLILPGQVVAKSADLLEGEGDRGEPKDAMKPIGVDPIARQSVLASFGPKAKLSPLRTFERSLR